MPGRYDNFIGRRTGFSCGIYRTEGRVFVIKIKSGYLRCGENMNYTAVVEPEQASKFENFMQAISVANLAQRLTSKEVTIEPYREPASKRKPE